ncbi:MAG: hypothetical protein OXN25_03725 [Candidatus Poribacteria bacterium]|nr:hypothetical protein [Candidatus Poribacteria bacterium]
MKIVSYDFSIAVVCGITFFLIFHNRPVRSAATTPLSTPSDSRQNSENSSIVTQKSTNASAHGSDLPIATSTSKKKCACCTKTSLHLREAVKQKRQELELWAREMIANYGYEEGMKRVAAKSTVLAERIQRLLEEEKHSNQISAGSQTSIQ